MRLTARHRAGKAGASAFVQAENSGMGILCWARAVVAETAVSTATAIPAWNFFRRMTIRLPLTFRILYRISNHLIFQSGGNRVTTPARKRWEPTMLIKIA